MMKMILTNISEVMTMLVLVSVSNIGRMMISQAIAMMEVVVKAGGRGV